MKTSLAAVILAAVILAASAVLTTQADEYERALQEAIKQYPPGDYGSPTAPAGVILFVQPKSVHETMLESLQNMTAPKPLSERPQGVRALDMLQEAQSRQNPQGQPLIIEEKTRGCGLLNREISLGLTEVTPEDAFQNILKDLDLRYEIRGQDIFIKEKEPAGQPFSK